MTLYDPDNPRHLSQLGVWRARGAAHTLSRRGQPGFCVGCGWTRGESEACRNEDCLTALLPRPEAFFPTGEKT